MNQKSILDLIGQAAGMFEESTTQTGTSQKQKAKSGFSLLQPMLQHALDKDDIHPSGTKVEDLDDDNVMDLISNVAGGLNVGNLLNNFDMDQVTDIISFVSQTFNGASNAKQEEHASGFSSLLSGAQSMGLGGGNDMANVLGTVMSLLRK